MRPPSSPRTSRSGSPSPTTAFLPFDQLEAGDAVEQPASRSAQFVGADTPPPRAPLPSPAPSPNLSGSAATIPARRRTPTDLADRDFTITGIADLTADSTRSKVDANLAAIRLLKHLQAAGRDASSAEQRILTRYVGWGASELARIVGSAEPQLARDRAARAELQALLSPNDFLTLRSTILNAHYSYADIPRAMWTAVERAGFQGGRVLEPAVGSGHFFGTMPPALRANSELHAVEKDPTTAAIAQQLYPSAHVQATAFETARLPSAYFDLAIGNVPFGMYGVADPLLQATGRAHLAKSIHTYFIAKTLDLLRAGGLLMYITSRYTLDAQAGTARRYLAERADFLGAARLPRQAFSDAGTEVVTDVLVLRKRSPDQTPADYNDWLQTALVQLPSPRTARPAVFHVNQYFVAHPEQVLGTATATGNMHGSDEYTVCLEGNQLLLPELHTALTFLSTQSWRHEPDIAPPAPAKRLPPDTGAKAGEFHIDTWGRVYTTDDDTRQPLNLSAAARARIQRFVRLRDAYRAVLAAMLDRRDDNDVTAAQRALRTAYDTFTRIHGPLNAAANRRALSDDPESARLFALEDVEWIDTKGGARTVVVRRLADIFTTRTISAPEPPQHAQSARDALVHSLAWRGDVDLPYMATLRGVPETTLAQELDGTELFRDPHTQAWATRDDVLSGDVVGKLEAAEARAVRDPDTWRTTVDALRAVQPVRLPPEDIDIRLGSAWVPVETYQAFAGAELGVAPDAIAVQFLNTEVLTRWSFAPLTPAATRCAASHDLNIADRDFFALLTDAANVARPEVRRPSSPDTTAPDPQATTALRESIRQLDERFRNWWRDDPTRAEQLADLYNRTFNRTVLRTFDGQHLALPGSNPAVQLRPHQKSAIWRILQAGNTLVAHAVGAGKTYVLTAAAMEMRRLHVARKPLIAVPNHMLEQWRRDILCLYPAARVLAPMPGDLTGKPARQRFMGRIAAGDWDIVLLTHSAFERLPIRPAAFERFVEEQIAQLQDFLLEYTTQHDKKTAKQIEAAIQRLETKLKNRAKQWAKDRTLTFEELGVDALMIDEAHLFKNLFFWTKLHRIAGLSRSESDRAIDMFLKVRCVNERTGNRGVIFATATPVANAVSELFTMQRYLAMHTLTALGLANFDSWKQQFADVVEVAEAAPEGGYRTRARLRRYTNVSELITLFRGFADVLTTEDLALPIPKIRGGRPTLVVSEPMAGFTAFLDRLRQRVDKVRSGQVDPCVDNMLKITTEAAAAAIDMRLIDPSAPDDPAGRLAQAAERIAALYRRWSPQCGTQLVFLDVGIPRDRGLMPLEGLDDVQVANTTEADDADTLDNVADGEVGPPVFTRNLYSDLKHKLVARGVNPREIAFVHQARNSLDKKRLFAAVNAGRIRVLVGSTLTLGFGTNVQARLVALHHIDVPWRPADLEQREGRILRQGNIFFADDPTFEVEIFRYITRRTFDEYRWALLATKQSFISQLLRGRLGIRTFEDTDPSQLSFEEASAAASGDARTMQLLTLRQELARLDAKALLFDRRVSKARLSARHYEHTERHQRALATRLPVFATAFTIWNHRVSIGPHSFRIDAAADRAGLRTAIVTAITQALRNTLHLTDTVLTIGTVGPLYDITAHLSSEYDSDHRVWHRSVAVQLHPQSAWTDIAAAIIYGAPSWNVTTEPDSPPDIVRSFDTRWKSPTWITDLGTHYAQRAAESAQSRALELAIIERPFPQRDALDRVRRQVRDLERALQAHTAPPSIAPAPTQHEHSATVP